MTPQRSCPICNGAGTIYRTPVSTLKETCRRCEGRGIVPVRFRDETRLMLVSEEAWRNLTRDLADARARIAALEEHRLPLRAEA